MNCNSLLTFAFCLVSYLRISYTLPEGLLFAHSFCGRGCTYSIHGVSCTQQNIDEGLSLTGCSVWASDKVLIM